MCVHHWIIDSYYQGKCRKCGEQKDFSPPPIRLTHLEMSKQKLPFNFDYYMKGGICLDELNALSQKKIL
jgi:hypothetical protein